MTTDLFASRIRILKRTAAVLPLILPTIAAALDAAQAAPIAATPYSLTETLAMLAVHPIGNHMLRLTISGALPGATFDLYFINTLYAQRWQWRRVCNGIQCDGAGLATFDIHEPDPAGGYFEILDAADDDGDGLSNGYETWFKYSNGNQTKMNLRDSDGDGMNDGWEVEYGLDPLKPLLADTPPYDPDGANADPDSDNSSNNTEYNAYYGAGPTSWNATFDPLRNPSHPDPQSPYKGPNRPVITISDSNGIIARQTASFTITRDLGAGVSLSSAPDLTVYYSVGGTLNYNTGDYTLSPAPPEWPRIYSAVIKAGQPSVAVIVELKPTLVLNGVQTVEIAVNPYAVSPVNQVSDPKQWLYVVDWKHNRTSLRFSPTPVELPSVGTGFMRILSSGGANTAPPLLELVQITSDTNTWNFSTALPSASQFQVTVNGTLVPSDVQQVGFKRRPLFAPLESADLRIENALYLKLANPIPDNALAQVINPNWPAAPPFVAVSNPLRYSPVIHVNQEGYLPSSPQKALIGYYCGTLGQMNLQPKPGVPIPASSVKLVDAVTGADVSGFNPLVSLRNENSSQSVAAPQYQGLIEVDFNGYTASPTSGSGLYLLRVQGLGASFPFRIDNGIAMKIARTFALGLYHQRCGSANTLPFTRFTHDPCHTAMASIPIPLTDIDPLPDTDPFKKAWDIIADVKYAGGPNPYQFAPPLTNLAAQRFQFAVNQPQVQHVTNQYLLDVSGGHHDAGDYSKYTINSSHLIHTLVFAADNFPNVAALDNLGIPESGDGNSDILQEAKWEADFLLKMQDNGTLDTDGHPVVPGGFYTLVYPRDREYEDNVLPDHGDRQIVWPKTTSVTAAAVGALAEIGSSPKFRQQFPTEAASYLAAAQRGWSFLMTAIDTFGKLGSYQTLYNYGDIFTHNDELAWAAAAMFAANFSDTNSAHDPHTLLLAWYPDPTGNGPIPGERCDTDPNAPQCDGDTCDNAPCRAWKWGWWRMYEGYGCAARDYAFAARSGRRTNGLDSVYLSRCQTAITAWGDSVRSWSTYNAYRTTVMASGVAGFGWHPEFFFPSSWSFDIAVSDQIEGHTSLNRAALIENMNYEAGRNPNNVSFLPGLGWKRQRAVVSQYAWNDDRVLPPSGNPVGNIAFQFEPDINNYQLNSIYYPANTDGPDSFALYDRWADAYNVKTEFVCPQTARSLAVTALLAAENSTLRQQPWCSADASIIFQNGSPKLMLNSPAPVQLTASLRCGQTSLDFSTATILWELQGHEPTFGGLTPTRLGDFRLEAEAVFPDGRRVFAVEPGVLVYDPITGGTPYTTDPNTIALYNFNGVSGSFSDVTGHGHNLAVSSGSVSFAKAIWMRNPDVATDKVARFSNAGNELQASFANTLIRPPLTIDARIFARAYKGGAGQQIFSLQQEFDSQFSTYYDPDVSQNAPALWTHQTMVLAPQEWQDHISLNTWHNIRITYTLVGSNPTTTVYIDGAFQKTVNTPVVHTYTNPWTLYIGNFDGDVDEVRISNIDRGPLQ